MKALRSTFVATLVAFTALVPRLAGAITTQHLSSDEELAGAMSEAKTAFVAEGRIGDRAASATFEAGLGAAASDPAVTGQHDWQKGLAEPFTLVYNTERKIVLFALGNNSLLFTPPAGIALTDMIIRADSKAAGASVRISDLVIRSSGVRDSAEASGAGGRDILWIRGADLANGFLMTGFATLSWQGSSASQSGLEFEIRVGEAAAPTATDNVSWGKLKAKNR